MSDLFMEVGAEISECRRFRYALIRRWADGPMALFIMLNPSTADHWDDDPTIRRCISFAKREGCGGLRVENLYAFRATDPNEMFRNAHTALGATDRFIKQALEEADGPVIAAWGADVRAERRAAAVLRILSDAGASPLCLGVTKSGAPRHPLYVHGATPLVPFNAN